MNFDNTKHYLETAIADHFPIYDCIVMQNGRQLCRFMGGYTDKDKTAAPTGNETYWIYSCSKVSTVTAAMMLVEQGKMSLDDDVAKYLPEFADVMVKNADGGLSKPKNSIKIADLFSMTSGIDYDINIPGIQQAIRNNGTTREIVAQFSKKPLLFNPGEHWCYGLSHDILAAIVEVISGMKFSEFMSKNIFEPLKMTDTTYHPTKDLMDRMCQRWRLEGEYKPDSFDNWYKFTDNYESGGAGLVSCTEDYAKFIDALASGSSPDGYRLLKPETVDIIRKGRLTDEMLNDFWKKDEGYNYGLGVYTVTHDFESGVPAGTFGWDGAAGSFISIDTKNKISIMFMTHLHCCDYSLHSKMRNEIYRDIFSDN